MRYHFFKPSPVLQPYIDYYFAVENSSDDALQTDIVPLKVYPAPHPQMAFNFGDTTYEQVGRKEKAISPDMAVSGYFTTPVEYYTGKNTGAIMVGFRPMGIKAFVPFPIGEVNNVNLPLEDIYGAAVKEVEEQLRECHTMEQRIQRIENWFCSVLRPLKKDDMAAYAIDLINKGQGIITVRTVANKCAIGKKQFERRFKDATGITPKLFSRIVRFQHVFNHLSNGNLRMVEKALEGGFYDQSHFIREFKEFTGLSPKEYVFSVNRSEAGMYFEKMTESNTMYKVMYE